MSGEAREFGQAAEEGLEELSLDELMPESKVIFKTEAGSVYKINIVANRPVLKGYLCRQSDHGVTGEPAIWEQIGPKTVFKIRGPHEGVTSFNDENDSSSYENSAVIRRGQKVWLGMVIAGEDRTIITTPVTWLKHI